MVKTSGPDRGEDEGRGAGCATALSVAAGLPLAGLGAIVHFTSEDDAERTSGIGGALSGLGSGLGLAMLVIGVTLLLVGAVLYVRGARD